MINRKQSSALEIIKRNLSNDFKPIELKSIENIPELSDMILYSKLCVIKAKVKEENNIVTIHLRIENVEGMVYEGFTENYEWFLQTFSFK